MRLSFADGYDRRDTDAHGVAEIIPGEEARRRSGDCERALSGRQVTLSGFVEQGLDQSSR